MYGQPGAPAVVPTSLTSVPLAQYDTQTPGSRDANKDKPSATDDKPTNAKSNQASKKKKQRSRNRNKKTGEVQDQDENDDAVEPENTKSTENDVLAMGGPAFWASLGSSDSDFSDTELGSSSKLPSIASRVRVSALATFHAMIKVNVLMSYPCLVLLDAYLVQYQSFLFSYSFYSSNHFSYSFCFHADCLIFFVHVFLYVIYIC